MFPFRTILNLAAKQLPAQVKSRIAVGWGDAAEEITRLSTSESADVIVIATHGLAGGTSCLVQLPRRLSVSQTDLCW
jgi:hypothetical protein